MKLEMRRLSFEWLMEIIQLCIERIIVVDRDGIVIYIDGAYCEFLGISFEEAIGRPVQAIIENTRMHIVARTGQKEIEHLHPINGSVMIANRYPIFIEGQLVGALGTVIYSDPDNVRAQKNKITNLCNALNLYKNKALNEGTCKYTFDDLVGDSYEFQVAKALGEKVARNDSSVLVTGETGTGKELFAHAIHHSSMRSDFPFVAINCASIPELLFETELFGYEDGAFTGAKKGGKLGLLKLANKGTIFLDEIGDMPLSVQSKLLRALQEKEIQPVAGQKSIPIDIRLIAATNRDLEKMVQEGTFRQDLFYRLNVISIEIPPLRKRKEDIEAISQYLLRKIERRFYKKGTMLSSEVVDKLQRHMWPGNIRELENVLERAINVLDGTVITLEHLPLYIKDQADHSIKQEPPINNASTNGTVQTIQPLKETLAQAEKRALVHALTVTSGDKLAAAKLLGIGKTSFYDKCKLYGVK
ncbi:sigma 54-interacting transcriptional regulator [Alkalihalobacillus sp. MEB130]|uniref:sigma-54 interaction domain-containing protein n=1 Tax=Alkalihalobacillus sp. MEB130 TaxID=2976704 RepID=UPI0028DFE530|nr:sigma 54-interacting transcriptional regulator [Alkalihalobacillus sp. MEB130]MDT8860155.1 sigma 54-interacting transcriptional regulator [Alkalihalobacillus sp. MEB130]